ncbi:tryptophan-rich sensory protein [Candidatus Woesearchaeota archaeon]|nr:tryptophan-rich sensory protein [Candidatus Woesearchaeota archaeon]
MIDWKKLIASLVVCQLAGLFGSIFNISSIPTWYAGLVKPSFNPPNWVFAPVWTTLFVLMGVSLYLVWVKKAGSKKQVRAKKAAYAMFWAQFVLNILWSFFFFYLRCPLCGLVEIIFLWIAIVSMIILFHKISRTAAYLQIPYLLWVSFAAVLNFMLFYLN